MPPRNFALINPEGLEGGFYGARGFEGPAGSTGAAGMAGRDGSMGSRAYSGAAGVKGDVGASGSMGPRGYSGAAGVAGSTGPRGYSGAAGVAGLTGARGDTGMAGASGSMGPRGYSGAAGVAGAKGDMGVAARPTLISGSRGRDTLKRPMDMPPNETARSKRPTLGGATCLQRRIRMCCRRARAMWNSLEPRLWRRGTRSWSRWRCWAWAPRRLPPQTC